VPEESVIIENNKVPEVAAWVAAKKTTEIEEGVSNEEIWVDCGDCFGGNAGCMRA
jgi:hypothetical protein